MPEAQLKMTCQGCGSALEYSAGNQALKCPYCNNVTEIPKIEEEAAPRQASMIVPLSVEVSALTDAVYEHLATGDLTPDHLLEHATFTQKERFYVPAYDFDGEFVAHWTASFGYDREEHYTAIETRTENGRSYRVPVTKTKTVTDWRPVNGTDSGRFSVRSYAGKRLLEAGLDAASLVENMPSLENAPFDASYTTGVPVEEITSPSTDVYSSRAAPRINRIIDQSVQKHAQGDHQKDWHWKGTISKSATTLLVPICHAVYEFEGRQFNVWVSGSDTSRLVADPLPVDQRRKRSIQLGFLPLPLSLVSAGLAIFRFDSNWGLPLCVAAVAGIYGVIRKKSIISYSRRLRKALLAARNVAASNTAQMSVEEQNALAASVAYPRKPWIFNRAVDTFALPIVAVLAAAIPFGGLIHRGATDVGVSAATSSESAHRELTGTPMSPRAATPPSAKTAAVIPTERDAAVQAVRATSNPGSQASDLATLAAILQPAESSDWSGVDQQVIKLRAEATNEPVVDAARAQVQNNLGTAAFRSGDLQAAILAFQRAAEANPSDPAILDNWAFALLRAQRSDEAVHVLAGLLHRFPDRATAWINLSEAATADTASATTALKLGFHFHPDRQKLTNHFAPLATSYGDERYRSVIANVLASVDTIPQVNSVSVPVSAEQRAEIAGSPGNSQQSPTSPPLVATTEPPRQATAGRADLAPIADILRLAQFNDWSGVDAEARNYHSESSASAAGDPNAARSKNSEGIAALRRNDLGNAIAAFQGAADADPSDPVASDNLGVALFRAHRTDEAIHVLTGLLRRFPDRPMAWVNLSEALAPDVNAAAALKLAFYFNPNRDKMQRDFASQANTSTNLPFRTVIASVLPSVTTIPIGGNAAQSQQ
jgi:LSD1 subclass zinc finger protein